MGGGWGTKTVGKVISIATLHIPTFPLRGGKETIPGFHRKGENNLGDDMVLAIAFLCLLSPICYLLIGIRKELQRLRQDLWRISDVISSKKLRAEQKRITETERMVESQEVLERLKKGPIDLDN
jgi:hypothetical protein